MGLLDGFSDIVIRILGDTSGLEAALEEAKGQLADLDVTAKDLVKIGAVFTTIGVAVTALTDDAKKMNAELGMTAANLGITTDEMRGLAIETADAGFSLSEVQKTFDLLARSGVKSTDDLTAIAKSMDQLGGATGNAAEATTAIMIPALRAFDIPLQDVGKHSDALTYMVRNSTVGLDDFSATMNKLAPDLQEAGLSMEDVIAILMGMNEQGIQGKTALSLFAQGLKEGGADLEQYKVPLGEVTGLTEKYDTISDSALGTMDQLTSMWSEFSFSVGSALEPLSGVGAAMAVIGPVIGGIGGLSELSSLLGGLGGAAGGAGGILGAGGIAGLAGTLLPLLPIIAAVAAGAALLYVAWTQDWGGIQEKAGAAFEWLQGAFQVLQEALLAAWEAMQPVLADLKAILEDIAGAIAYFVDWVGQFWDALSTGDTAKVKALLVDLVKAFAAGFLDISKDMAQFAIDLTNAFNQLALDALKWGAEVVIQLIFGIGNMTLDLMKTLTNINNVFFEILAGLPGDALAWGKDIILKLIDGIGASLGLDIKLSDLVRQFEDWIGGLPAMAFDWGINIIQSLLDGIASKARELEDSLINGPAKVVSDILGVHSPTEKGPLRDIDTWGGNIVSTIAQGIQTNAGLLTGIGWTAISQASISPQPAAPSMGGGIFQPILNFTGDMIVRTESDIDAIADAIAEKLNKSLVSGFMW
ncbi:MAG: phage tail tape measure protein [bacterium]